MDVCEASFKDFCKIYDEENGNLLTAALLALGNSVQNTSQTTNQGMMVELANIIEFISKKIALDARKFKSRLIFKAVAEIFQRELKKAGKHTIKIDQLKESMKGVTNNLVNHSNNCKDLIAKHASNVL